LTYAIDPELAVAAKFLPTLDLTDIPGQRRASAALLNATSTLDRPDAIVEDVSAPGGVGSPDIQMRIYRPKAFPAQPLPIIYDLHPGGFVLGSIEMNDVANRTLAIDLPAVVVSIDYRLAPETPFPGALEDCYAGVKWVGSHAAELNGDASRISLHGYSAGAGLAAALALLVRDRSGPSINFQYLGAPQLDDRLNSSSMKRFIDTPFVRRGTAERSWEAYLGVGTPDSEHVSAYAAPARATSLTGLPPTYIAVAEFDPMRDEGIAYAQALLTAGVSVELHLFPGTFHSSFIVDTAVISRREIAEKVTVLRRANGQCC
jgi:acetyl esterase